MVAVNDRTVRIRRARGSTEGAYVSLTVSETISISIADDDRGGLDVGTASGNTTEAGGTATFTVALRSAPAAPVTVAVVSRDGSEGGATPESLTFAATNWNTAPTVTVHALEDAATLTHRATGGDYDVATRRIVSAAAAVPAPAVGTCAHTVPDGDSAPQTVRIKIVANPRLTFSQPALPYTQDTMYTL